jgi:hypothetical protein
MQDHMFEANLILMHRSEFTRQILKWAMLCATTIDCIDPKGSILSCGSDNRDQESVCHRQDQSVFNVLVYNLELQLLRYGFPTLTHGHLEHPKNTKQRHQTRRFQQLTTGDAKLSC